jgi:hypothetical protein
MSRRVVLTIERLEDRTLFSTGITAALPPLPPAAGAHAPILPATILPATAADATPADATPADAMADAMADATAAEASPDGQTDGSTPEIYPPGVTDPTPDGSRPDNSPDGNAADGDNYPLPPVSGPAQHGVAQPPVFTLLLPLRDAPAMEATISAGPPVTAALTVATVQLNPATVAAPAVRSTLVRHAAADAAMTPARRENNALDVFLEFRSETLVRAETVAAHNTVASDAGAGLVVPASAERDGPVTASAPTLRQADHTLPAAGNLVAVEAPVAGALPAESGRAEFSWIASVVRQLIPWLLIVDRGVAWFVERRGRVSPAQDRDR